MEWVQDEKEIIIISGFIVYVRENRRNEN